MKKKKLDRDQEKAVACEKNVVVSAGAGSGKTTVLSKRYVRLIIDGKAAVENILTLTFTRKAAAEMYERIYHELLEQTDSERAREQSARFENAKISTLDSFSAEIVRSGSSLFGIPMDFTTDTEETAALAADSALDFLLGHQDDPFLKEFISLHGFENVYEHLFTSAAVNDFNIAEPVDFEQVFKKQETELNRVLHEKVSLLETLRQKISAAEPSGGKTYRANQKKCGEIGPFPFSEETINLKELSNFLNKLTFNIRLGKSVEAALQKEYILEIRKGKEVLQTVVSSLSSLPLVKGIFSLLSDFQMEFLALKRIRGILSFQDVASLAVRILEEDLELRRYYKEQFTHIMIDEFQDNNILQRKLLFLLAEKNGKEMPGIPGADYLEPGKLFFVGDEKQSIYSFRGADVSVFKKLQNEILLSGGETLSLRTNYRSEPPLIDFFNTFFSSVMADARKDYEAVFDGLKARSPSEGIHPSIRFFYKPYAPETSGEDLLSGKEAEAWHIAKTVKKLVEEKTLLLPDGDKGVRPAGYKDICLLMRSTSDQILYEKYFRRLNIPFTVQSVRALFLEAPINDLYNFLQLLVYREDSHAYAGVLRSPFFNLNDDVTAGILLKHQPAFAFDIEEFPELFPGEDDRIKYRQGRDLYLRLLKMKDIVPKTELIRILWYESGYRYFLLKNPLYTGYLEYFDYLEELARRSDTAGENLALFLDFIRVNLGKYEKIPDLELLRDETIGVQCMTIHKAKGLEFPVVIVADTGNSGFGTSDTKPYYTSDTFGISLKVAGEKGKKANYFFMLAKEEQTKKMLSEMKRILYVALTRAESHLILSGVHGKNNRNVESDTGKRTLLNMIRGGLGEEVSRMEHIPDYARAETEKVVKHSVMHDVHKTVRQYRDTVSPEIPKGSEFYTVTERNRIHTADFLSEKGEKLPGIPADNIITKHGLYSLFGTLCHRIIESRIKKFSFNEERFRGLEEVSSVERKILSSDAHHLADAFLSSSFHQKRQDRAKLESEFSFLYRSQEEGREVYLTGQADLLYEMDDEVVVIDFKTDQYKNPGEYEYQLAVYRSAVSSIFGKPVKSYLYYLRSGEAVLMEKGEIH